MREQFGLSQEALALNAGVDRTYVSGIERGVRNPSLKSMQRLAGEMNITLDRVFVLARQMAQSKMAAK